ncbi:hypothetical protein [uncultured Methylobacterium sp.]|uniref:hypothetical protein n=1 Tax=uncultured Methylobacterium sp. TaxID=157278 RepID=UPI0035C9C72C
MTAPVARNSALLAALAGAVLLAAPARAGGCYGSECYRHVSTPPVFDTVHENVLVRPPRTIYRTTPPVYDTVSERVLVSPGGRHWSTSRGPYGELIGCWVTTPPHYATQHRRVLVQPAQSIPETIPPEYASVSRRVLVAPARSGWVPVGGGYGGDQGGYGGGYHGGGYGGGYRSAGYGGGLRIGSIPDALGVTGASSADIGVGLGFSSGSPYDGY